MQDENQPVRSAAETLAEMQRITRERLMAPRHAIGDLVAITATVVGVNFTESKVNYVVQIGDHVAIVDSCDVEPAAKVA